MSLERIKKELIQQDNLIKELELSIEVGAGLVHVIKKIVKRVRLRRARRKQKALQAILDQSQQEGMFV